MIQSIDKSINGSMGLVGGEACCTENQGTLIDYLAVNQQL